MTLRAALAWILALVILLPTLDAARAGSPQLEERRCRVPSTLVADDSPLPATAAVIRSHQLLTIVALGSSSTAGVGASSKRSAYPAVMERELRLWLGPGVRVVNRGIGGETIDRTAARIDADVIPLKPTLVIWQTGTNDLLRSEGPAGPERFARILAAGIQRIRSRRIDLVLMDLQYFPRGERRAELNTYLQAIDRVADRYDIPVLHRHRIMSYWLASGELSLDQMLSRDRFHMSDEGYRCLGEIVAEFILRRCGNPGPSNPILHAVSQPSPALASGR